MKIFLISPASLSSGNKESKIYKLIHNKFKSKKSDGYKHAKSLHEGGDIKYADLFKYIGGANYFGSKLEYANSHGDKTYILTPFGLVLPDSKLNLSSIVQIRSSDIKKNKKIKLQIQTKVQQQLKNVDNPDTQVYLLGSFDYTKILEPAIKRLKYSTKVYKKGMFKTAEILREYNDLDISCLDFKEISHFKNRTKVST